MVAKLLKKFPTFMGTKRFITIQNIKPVVVYTCQTCSKTEKYNTMSNILERKILKNMYEPVTKHGVWRKEPTKN